MCVKKLPQANNLIINEMTIMFLLHINQYKYLAANIIYLRNG